MKLNYQILDVGLHSLRSGGATSAVSCNPYLSEKVLKLHGRWKFDTTTTTTTTTTSTLFKEYLIMQKGLVRK